MIFQSLKQLHNAFHFWGVISILKLQQLIWNGQCRSTLLKNIQDKAPLLVVGTYTLPHCWCCTLAHCWGVHPCPLLVGAPLLVVGAHTCWGHAPLLIFVLCTLAHHLQEHLCLLLPHTPKFDTHVKFFGGTPGLPKFDTKNVNGIPLCKIILHP